MLAKDRLSELRRAAETHRLLKSLGEPESPNVPPGLARLVELKQAKANAVGDIEALCENLQAHPNWSGQPAAAAQIHHALQVSLSEQAKAQANSSKLEHSIALLVEQLIYLARIWCALEGRPVPSAEAQRV